MTVTEFARIGVKPGVDVDEAVTKSFDIALTQPGAQRTYWSLEIENPLIIWGFMDWDTIEDHINWTKHPLNAEVGKSLEPFFEPTGYFVKHVALEPFPPAFVLDSARCPVTELFTAFFPSDITPAAKATVTASFEEFIDKALKTSPDFKGISYGWGIETDFPVTGEEGKTGSIFVAFIGWPSVEAHMKFRETQPFKENVGAIRALPDLIKAAASHVRCKYQQRQDSK